MTKQPLFSAFFTCALLTNSAFAGKTEKIKETVSFKCLDNEKKVVLEGSVKVLNEDLSDPNYRAFNLEGSINVKALNEQLKVTGSLLPTYRQGILIYLDTETEGSVTQTARVLLNGLADSDLRFEQDYKGHKITLRYENLACSKVN